MKRSHLPILVIFLLPSVLIPQNNYSLEFDGVDGNNGTISGARWSMDVPTVAADTSPVAYYPFNGNANDESGNGNNGTVNGATLAVDRFGNANSAYNFDGVDDYIAIPSTTEMGKGWTDITITAWFNKTGVNDGRSILAKDVWTGGENNALFQFQTYANGDVSLWLHTTTDNHANITSTIPADPGNWNFVVGIYDGSTMSINVNGQAAGSSPMTGALVSGYTHYDLDIGSKYQTHARGSYFDGLLDDIRIYNRALSASEIDSLYHEDDWLSISNAQNLPIPSEFMLIQNYPNPFNPTSTIRYDLPEAAKVTLIVYDILGREVIRLVDQEMQPGYRRAVWDGRDHAGRSMPSGIYIARLVMPEYSKSIKMLLLK